MASQHRSMRLSIINWGQTLSDSPSSRQVFVALRPSWLDTATTQCLARTSSAAVVIDALRFTTTACNALHNGAASVHVAATVERARELAASLPASTLLCGERLCNVIEGFDLGNSPLDFVSSKITNRELVFSTTNGTVAVEAVKHCRHIFLAALVNRRATCRHLSTRLSGDVTILCAGTDGQLAIEDLLTAGAIVEDLVASGTCCWGHDTAKLAAQYWQAIATESSPSAIYREFSQSLGGRNLLLANYDRDIQFAAKLDSIDAVIRNVEPAAHRFQLARTL